MQLSSLLVSLSCILLLTRGLYGADLIWTIGGGYSPEGNQASLEANVLFFQRVIHDTRSDKPVHQIHFADGFDPKADVQMLEKADSHSSDALELLHQIFAPPGAAGGSIVYRNHAVPDISGSNRLHELREGFQTLKSLLKPGDRLIVYVTAHGGSARGDEPYNTSITCWGNRDLSMREFSGWLDTLPASVPVVLVMAQCYCGGFAHTVFTKGDSREGLAANVRTGFFAQRHDLPAAGCRPDVENDEEYSSYFWGALVGHSRSGKPAVDVDCDADGKISLAEAHAHAVVASDTIDIPLCGSDALLRAESRIAAYEIDDTDASRRQDAQADTSEDPRLRFLSGSLQGLADRASPTHRRMIVGLSERLNLRLDDDVSEVFEKYADARRDYRTARRSGGGPGSGRRGRSSFGRRREVRDAILERWPELEDASKWPQSELLVGDAARTFMEEVEAMPSYQAYQRAQEQREASQKALLEAEMRQVRFQRLIHTLESVVLAENLQLVASPEVLKRYQAMLELEQGTIR